MKIVSIILFFSAFYYLYFFLTRNNIGSWFFFVMLVNASTILLIFTQSKPKEHWFRAHQYGYGWSPSSWQGLSLTLVYALLIAATVLIAERNAGSISDALLSAFPLGALTFSTLIAVCMHTGEKATWRWGDKR